MENFDIREKNEDYKKFYKKIRKIGKGRYGKVYEAQNKESKEIRALKILDIDDNEDDDFMKYIKNELYNMKICSDKNKDALKYYECFHYKNETKNKFIIVMELCDENLQNLLDKKKEGFKCEEIFEIMSQLNNTFKIMKQYNIVHRDIKLDNILVKKYSKDNNVDSILGFQVKLSDFGISKRETDMTKAKTFIGTPLTMAPEIYRGENNYNYKCDLWSIGIIIYQLFFKDYPYKGLTGLAIYNNIMDFGPSLLKSTNNDNLDNLIRLLLKADPNERLDYEGYFNHPFFKVQINKLNKDIIYNKKEENKHKEDSKNDNIEDIGNYNNISNNYCKDEKIEMNENTIFFMNIFISICYCFENNNIILNQDIIEDKNNYNEINKYEISKSQLNKKLSEDLLVKAREDFNISCIEYAPKIFAYLRKLDNIKEEEIINSLLPNNNRIKIKTSNKNEKDTICTDDNELILKRLTFKEVEKILDLDFLGEIAKYLYENPKSIIERIYGIYKITTKTIFFKKEEYYILIKNIIGPFGDKMICQYNLKGSRIKSKDINNINMDKVEKTVYGEKTFLEHEIALAINQIYSIRLLNIAGLDAQFLCNLGVMDYSLFIIKFSLDNKTKEQLFGKNYEKINFTDMTDIYADNNEKEERNRLQKYCFPSLDKSNLYVVVIRDYFKYIRAKNDKVINIYKSFFVKLVSEITNYEDVINRQK